MADRGTVFDLGYRPYDGDLLGRSGTRWAIVRDGMRRVLGLRRRARTKVLPWGLLTIALFPAVVFIGIGVIGGELIEGDIFGHADYFELTGPIALIFIALASAELLIPDRTEGTIQVYASRPLTPVDYLASKAGALVALVAAFMMLPQLMLWIGFAAISREGFLGYVGSNTGDLARSVAATAVYLLAYLPIAFAVASIANRTAVAAGAFAAAFFATAPLTAAVIDQQGPDLVALAALDHHPRYVRDWIFDTDTHAWIPERAGFEPVVSLITIAVVAVVAGYVILRRYRRFQ
jgi:ABC-2 type transport system permease protein